MCDSRLGEEGREKRQKLALGRAWIVYSPLRSGQPDHSGDKLRDRHAGFQNIENRHEYHRWYYHEEIICLSHQCTAQLRAHFWVRRFVVATRLEIRDCLGGSIVARLLTLF